MATAATARTKREMKKAWIRANPEKYQEQKRRWRQRRRERVASGRFLVSPEQREGKVIVARLRFRNGQNPHAMVEEFMKQYGRAGVYYALGPMTNSEFRTILIYADPKAAERIKRRKVTKGS
jgi:hypothetical protein